MGASFNWRVMDTCIFIRSVALTFLDAELVLLGNGGMLAACLFPFVSLSFFGILGRGIAEGEDFSGSLGRDGVRGLLREDCFLLEAGFVRGTSLVGSSTLSNPPGNFKSIILTILLSSSTDCVERFVVPLYTRDKTA